MLKLLKRRTPSDMIAAQLKQAQYECDEAALAYINATEQQARAKVFLAYTNDKCARLQAALSNVTQTP